MSRAFIKEDNQQDTPFVPPRADLPKGVTNYVTPFGLQQLLNEKEDLLADLKRANEGHELTKIKDIKIINIKLGMLEERIATATVIEHQKHDNLKVRFGSIVLLKIGNTNNTRQMQIVGVDEADLKKNKIAFISPLAKVLINKTVGEVATLKLERGESNFTILEIK
ncbi:MAG: transcription elongation factor GreA [Proteiniphilum sp.]|nr:transcription elongation factor GreA [Proteiniphilum sp.]